MEIDNRTEATMQAATISDTATPRYGYAPQIAFAATRAFAERQLREASAAPAPGGSRSRSTRHLIRRLATLLTASAS